MFPLLDFDPDPNAIINPLPAELSEPAPRRAVACFFLDVLQALAREGSLVEIGQIGSEAGLNPLYRLTVEGRPVLVFHPGVGAPMAAAFTDEVIALGVTALTACGGCGVLRRDIAAGHPLIVTAAVRDEGTSFHYAPPSYEIAADPRGVAALEASCRGAGIDYRLGKSWTTDGFYRETSARREKRILEGCDVVEMEASAFFAVTRFRQVPFGLIVYGGDLVVPEGWDSRNWQERVTARRLLFDLAVQAVLRL